ncbi:unnamed protein product, partial [Sphacelaria rigidula]
DRPLTGAKPAASAPSAEERSLGATATEAGDERPLGGATRPPREFPAEDGGSGSTKGNELQEKEESGSRDDCDGEGAEVFMTAHGLLKLREEADPCSMDVGVLGRGDIVKVLETNGKWVRVAYRGREDGWTLTANKRGPTMSPTEGDVAAAALAFNEQEANFAQAEAAAASVAPSGTDRPLTGAKPAAGVGDERPLGGGKGAWAPPSEFPADGGSSSGAGGELQDKEGGGGEGASGEGEMFMTALG